MIVRLIVKTFILSAFCFTSQHTLANKKLTENYISTYKSIAVVEMRRTGIPASIKLAQGILESDLGRSPLTLNTMMRQTTMVQLLKVVLGHIPMLRSPTLHILSF